MKSGKIYIKWIAFLLTVIVLLTACSSSEGRRNKPFTDIRSSLGTVINISVYDANPGDETLIEYLQSCHDVVQDIDRRMTVNAENSEIQKLNKNAGAGEYSVSQDTYELLEKAGEFSRRSGGAFDVTVGVISDLWRVDGGFARLPSEDEIQRGLHLVGYEKLVLKTPPAVLLNEEGMAVDLGAIAKGYACDRAAAVLREKGIKHAILDFGGNIYALGTRPDGSPWRVGIKMPIIGESGLVCSLEISDMAVVTSGGYERYFEEGGVVYHHLLDPKTGYPVDNRLLSVSVVAKSSTDADALSTACFVLGLEEGMKLVKEYGYEGIFVTEDYRIHITDGLKDRIKIMDDRFALA